MYGHKYTVLLLYRIHYKSCPANFFFPECVVPPTRLVDGYKYTPFF